MEYIQLLLAVCGGVSIVGGAGAVVLKLIRPAVRMEKRVSEVERRVEKDYAAIQKLIASNHVQTLALLAMVNHMIDGNGIEKLRETRDKLQIEIVEN